MYFWHNISVIRGFPMVYKFRISHDICGLQGLGMLPGRMVDLPFFFLLTLYLTWFKMSINYFIFNNPYILPQCIWFILGMASKYNNQNMIICIFIRIKKRDIFGRFINLILQNIPTTTNSWLHDTSLGVLVLAMAFTLPYFHTWFYVRYAAVSKF